MSAIRTFLLFSLVCITLQDLTGSGVRAAVAQPDDMVESGVRQLADAARSHGGDAGSTSQGLEDAVQQFLDEYTDVQYAARLILAGHWKATPPGQRERFVRAFNRHVANLLVKLVPDVDFDSVKVYPFQGDIEEIPLMVEATFQAGDEQTVEFLLVIHKREGRWLIFDVVAEGISYVKTFRNQFSGEISDNGFEAMIERFESRVEGPDDQT